MVPDELDEQEQELGTGVERVVESTVGIGV